MNSRYPLAQMSQFLHLRKEFFTIDDAALYQLVTVQLHARGIRERQQLAGAEIKTKRQQRIRAGDLLVAEIDAKVGGFGVVPAGLAEGIVSSHYFLYEIDIRQIDPRYMEYYLKSGQPEQDVQQFVKGSVNYAAIRPHHFPQLHIPLPPLDEQRRIVARIEALAGRITEAQRLQEGALKEAVALWAAGVARVFRHLENAPRRAIQEICEVRGGLQKQPNRIPRDHPTPYLTVAHVQRSRIDLSVGLRYFEISPRELALCKLEPGDLLIIEGNGSADQIGRAAIFRGEVENCVHQNHVIRARPDPSLVLSEYLNSYLNSPVGMEEVRRRSRTTSGLLTLSVGRIREIELPIPSLDEQRHAVVTLNELQARVDALRRLQESTQAELAALLPAVLDKAFRGEL